MSRSPISLDDASVMPMRYEMNFSLVCALFDDRRPRAVLLAQSTVID
jgi:hypothetical protein